MAKSASGNHILFLAIEKMWGLKHVMVARKTKKRIYSALTLIWREELKTQESCVTKRFAEFIFNWEEWVIWEIDLSKKSVKIISLCF